MLPWGQRCCFVVCSQGRGQKELFTQPTSVWHGIYRGQADLGTYLHVLMAVDLAKVLMWDIRNEHESTAKLIPLLKPSFLLIIFNDLQGKCLLQLF